MTGLVCFFGASATLTLGTGPDYSICDVYLNGMYWRSFDNHAATAGEDAISISMQGEGPHVLEVRNRAEKNKLSLGYKVAFKQLVSDSEYDLHTILYQYDGLSRLMSADYYHGQNLNGVAYHQYDFSFDLAGNRTEWKLTVDSSDPAHSASSQTKTYSYNAANQLTNTGFVYDDAGRMTNDGTNTHVWDRANRLLSMDGIAYAYDGLSNRISQTASSVVTEYLNDIQPSLTKVLSETVGSDVTRFIHGPRGIQAVWNEYWQSPVQDGLGSVRDNALSYSPFGVPDASVEGFAFTGEQRDANGLQYHRARYYSPELGVWPSLDPVEDGNRYAYVNGNPATMVDPSGLQAACSQFEFTNAMQYSHCLRSIGANPCPSGYPVENHPHHIHCLLSDGSSQHALNL